MRAMKAGPRAALAALSGVLYFTGYTGFGQFYLTWICFVPALLAVRGCSTRRALALGLVFGWVTQLGGFYWISEMLQEFAGFPAPAAWLGTFLLCLYQALICAASLAWVRFAENSRGWAPVWTLPIAMTAIEFVYPLIFPNYIGYSQYRFLAVTQVVELAGLSGLTALLMGINGAVYEGISARLAGRRVVRLRLWLPAAALGFAVVYGLARVPALDRETAGSRTLRVAMVQENIGAAAKARLVNESVDRHVASTRAALAADPSIDLVVWPETVYAQAVPRSPGPIRGLLGRGIDVPLVFGAISHDASGAVFNSLVLASSTGRMLGIFDKVELVAFGERIPFAETFPLLAEWIPAPSQLSPGTRFDHLVLEDGTRLLPIICYEDIIPSLVRRLWTRAGPAHVLVNATNDSWYGATHEPRTHLAMASFRSIETRRALIRSTNTGISAFVDPVGRIVARSAERERAVLIADVPLIESNSTTPYLRYGDWFGWLCLGLLTAGTALCVIRPGAPR